MALSAFTLSCNHHHSPCPELFHYPEQIIATPHAPQALVTSILLSVSMNLPRLDNSRKWNHTIFVLLWLAYFMWHNVFKVRPYCSMGVSALHVYLRLTNIPLYRYTTWLMPSSVWTLGLFPPFGYCESCYEHGHTRTYWSLCFHPFCVYI